MGLSLSVCLDQWFLTGNDFASPAPEHLAMFGDIFAYYYWGRGATGALVGREARDAAKHRTMHSTAP